MLDYRRVIVLRPICRTNPIQVHESSHHEFAYTDDVYSCGRSRYFWLRSDGLLGLSGFSSLQEPGQKGSQETWNTKKACSNLENLVQRQHAAHLSLPYSWKRKSRRSLHYLQSSVVQSLLFTTEFDFLWLFSLPWYVRHHSWEDDQRLNSKTSSCQLFHLHSLVVTGVKSKNLRWHPRSFGFFQHLDLESSYSPSNPSIFFSRFHMLWDLETSL